MVYALPRIGPGEWDAKILRGFCDKNGSPNFDRTTRPSDRPKKKKKKKEKKKKKRRKVKCRIVDFAVPVDDRVKLKESKKKDNIKTCVTWK